MTASQALEALNRFSAVIGADPLMVQAAGGNTSVKVDGRMWVKASGTWLADALARPIMVGVDLDPYREAVLAGAANPPATGRRGDGALRPSVETALHVVMPHRFVVHIHCVDTVAWSVQADADAALAPLLEGLSWAFVPYVKPGMPLAARVVAIGAPDVLVLGNHGLVVAADDLGDLAAMLRDVRGRLRRDTDPHRRHPTPAERADLEEILRETAFRPAGRPEAHDLALGDDFRAIAAAGTLYPDHAVFLGPAIRVASSREGVHDLAGDALARAVLVPGAGVGIRQDALRGADAMAACLTEVVTRLRPGDDIRYLETGDVAELLDWDAEKYRQSLNVAGPA